MSEELNPRLDFLIQTFILMQMRTYDLLLMLYGAEVGEEAAREIKELHEEGQLFCPPPFQHPESAE